MVNVLKCRCGQLWNKKLAFIRNMPYFAGQPPAKDMKCPLCGQPDSAGHMLGHCQHKDMAGSYIARHDEAMRKVIKATLKGQQGNNYIIADVGRLPELQRLGVHSKRIPAFVLPDEFVDTSGFAQQVRDAASDAQSHRNKMRPDIMTVEMTSAEYRQQKLQSSMHQLSPTMPTGCVRKVWMVEGGYCSDTRYVDKLHEKQQQHQRLEASLRACGYAAYHTRLLWHNTNLSRGDSTYSGN